MTAPQSASSTMLEGLRILDLTRLLPGPYLSLMMVDMGARVAKVEDPRMGDYMRWSPPNKGGFSQIFAALNRGKQSIALNLKDPSHKAVFERLVKKADVVMESFRPGVMARLGLDYESLSALNPRLIYLSISGFGQDGPLAERAGHDLNFLARAGILDLNRDASGRPVVPGFQSADIAGGALLPLARLMGALYHRERTGAGSYIDASMMHGALALSVLPSAEVLGHGPEYDPSTAVLAGSRACYNIYGTKDQRFMALAALEPKFWKGFCEAVERPEWIKRHLSVGEEAVALRGELESLFQEKPQAYWSDLFQNHDVCCEPVMTTREALHDPALSLDNPWVFGQGGDSPAYMRTPAQNPTEGCVDSPPPQLGADTRAILLEYGFSEAEAESFSK
jgi:alpha-methylacyl-CoA racemase